MPSRHEPPCLLISREKPATFLEGLCNVRYFTSEEVMKDGDPRSKTYGQIISRWTSTHSVRVRALAREFGGSGIAEYVDRP